ncbi:MAG: ornithine cyclodeaminase family protein [Dehalococcoidia bacterium]|nr:ornithine cyclodeaminase family protein [Dehalococcoidia bacterium]
MALYLTESEVALLLDMNLTLDALEESFKARARGEAFNSPRSRLPITGGAYNFMAASWPAKGVAGHKSYTGSRKGATFHVTLYDASGAGLLAIIEAGRLGQVRTGGASGVATKYMARSDASVVAVIGSGYQAETQLEAITAVRKIISARVFSRTPERRTAFAEKMSRRLGIPVLAMASATECVRSAHIIVTVTNSAEPVLTGDMLEPGMHINAAGANSWIRRELDTAAVAKCETVAVDDLDQARIECGELLRAADTGHFSWDRAVQIERIISGQVPGRLSTEGITLFESQGIALEDLAVAERIYRLALERKIGRTI